MEMTLEDSEETIRLVRSMKDDKWIFDEIGDLLWFEDEKYYSKRRIADRVTYDLLLSYSIKNGINFNSPDFLKQKKNLYGLMKCGNFLKISRINKGCRPVAKLSHTDFLAHIIA